jgi:hypothetical protein
MYLQEKKEYLFDFGTCEGDIFQLFSCWHAKIKEKHFKE